MNTRKLTAKQIALLNIIDAMRSDMANGADYMREQPNTHEELSEKTAAAVERHMHKDTRWPQRSAACRREAIMRDEERIRERIANLLRENETLRQQGAKHLLSEDWPAAKDTLSRIDHNVATYRALDWALGGKAS